MPSSCDCRELLQFAFWGDSICSFQTVPLLWPRVHTVRANRITCFMCCTSEWQRVQDSRLEAKTPRGVPWHTIQTHPGNGQHLPGQSSTVSNCFRNPSLTPHQSIVLAVPHLEVTTHMRTRARGWQFQPALFVLDPQKLFHQIYDVH